MSAELMIQIMGLISMLVGTITGFFFLRALWLALRSRHWPTVVGTLRQAGLREVEFEGRDFGGGVSRAGALAVDFSYDYEVDGRRYQGTRVTFSDFVNKSRRMVEPLLDQFRHARVVQVFYDPGDPSRCVLLPGARLVNFTVLISPLGFFLLGLFLLLRGPSLL